jgi:hypothetical protein
MIVQPEEDAGRPDRERAGPKPRRELGFPRCDLGIYVATTAHFRDARESFATPTGFRSLESKKNVAKIPPDVANYPPDDANKAADVANLRPDVANMRWGVAKFGLDDANCGRYARFCGRRVANCQRFASREAGQETAMG